MGCVYKNAAGCLRRATHRRLFVNGLDDKLLIAKGNVSDLTPGETNLWGQSEKESTRTSLLNLTQNNHNNMGMGTFKSQNNFKKAQ